MDIIQAINTRISCRAFTDKPVEAEKLEALAAEIERINAETCLNFQLYGPRDDGFVIQMSTKMFASNPPAYLALAGPVGHVEEEQLGYYGEKLILLATQLGLGTCWVASTYDRESTRVELRDGDFLHDVVPLGYAPAKIPLKQRTIRTGIRSRSKKNAEMWRGPEPLGSSPAWVQACIEAVQLAPSAINEQPAVFVQDAPDSPIRAELSQEKTGKEYTDLGIAKLHFELMAAEHGVHGTWEWGVGGKFVAE